MVITPAGRDFAARRGRKPRRPGGERLALFVDVLFEAGAEGWIGMGSLADRSPGPTPVGQCRLS
ncbi:hypothetical protein GGR03_001092 [Aurantimonas endophytica]|uniref:Uncharacterized protein n=1 Tax=Aurantimonas endophytica TaxID=1522175 RepID=A0A7W6MNM8_9HYPH|nr:hypothetical protein [Aurantimonas endophytica]